MSITDKHLEDITFVLAKLPPNSGYKVTNRNGSIHCKVTSSEGGMTDPEWEEFKDLCRKEFGERLLEFFHIVNTDHRDFIIYLKK